MEAESSGIWIEFYADLTHEGDKRSFTFFWPAGMDIAAFQYEIQQPWSADNIRVTAQGVAGVHTDGLVYHSASYGPLSAASQALISFAYENQDSALAAGVIVYVRFKRQDSATSPPRKRKRRRKTTGESQEEVDASPVYCHLCGVHGGASDHYCRRCGAQLRH